MNFPLPLQQMLTWTARWRTQLPDGHFAHPVHCYCTSEKDIWRLWSALGKCVLWDALNPGTAAVFPGKGEVGEAPNLEEVCGNWHGQGVIFSPKPLSATIWCLQHVASRAWVWGMGLPCSACSCCIWTKHNDTHTSDSPCSRGCWRPLILGMCSMKGSTGLCHLAEAKPMEIRKYTHWHPSLRIRDPCSDYCML